MVHQDEENLPYCIIDAIVLPDVIYAHHPTYHLVNHRDAAFQSKWHPVILTIPFNIGIDANILPSFVMGLNSGRGSVLSPPRNQLISFVSADISPRNLLLGDLQFPYVHLGIHSCQSVISEHQILLVYTTRNAQAQHSGLEPRVANMYLYEQLVSFRAFIYLEQVYVINAYRLV